MTKEKKEQIEGLVTMIGGGCVSVFVVRDDVIFPQIQDRKGNVLAESLIGSRDEMGALFAQSNLIEEWKREEKEKGPSSH